MGGEGGGRCEVPEEKRSRDHFLRSMSKREVRKLQRSLIFTFFCSPFLLWVLDLLLCF